LSSRVYDTLAENLYENRKVLEKLVYQSSMFENILRTIQEQDKKYLSLNSKTANAWLHLLMAMIYLKEEERDENWSRYVSKFRLCITDTMHQIIAKLPTRELLHQTAVLPAEVGLIVSYRLLQDVTKDQPDLSEIYSAYLRQLEAEIEANPSQREYQHSLLLVKQEMSIIRETLAKQAKIFAKFSCSSNSADTGGTSHPPRKYYVSHNEKGAYTSRYPPPPVTINHYAPEPVTLTRRTTERYDVGDYRNGTFILNEGPLTLSTLGNRIAADERGGLREALTQECSALIESRLQLFSQLTAQANYLEETVSLILTRYSPVRSANEPRTKNVSQPLVTAKKVLSMPSLS
jgi:hypothetical protein